MNAPSEHDAENLARAMSAEDWDARYADQVWSGEPNHALVVEAKGLPAGRAVDVACGEGADAVWLAQQGWQVTAVDLAAAAVERGRTAAQAAGVQVEWVVAPLADAGLPAGAFDLVSSFYPALPATPDQENARTLVDLVAPGGRLLVVHHVIDQEHAREHGFDPSSYVGLDDIAALLGDGWEVRRETRERHITGGEGAHHDTDDVLHARRL